MFTRALTYKAISVVVLLAIMPSIFGIHIFQHECYGCNEDETITRIITTMHSHEHACDDCSCEQVCTSCESHTDGLANPHHHEHDGACKHQFKKGAFDGQNAVVKYKFQADAIDLLFANFFVDASYSVKGHQNNKHFKVILKIPDDPIQVMNCVFLL